MIVWCFTENDARSRNGLQRINTRVNPAHHESRRDGQKDGAHPAVKHPVVEGSRASQVPLQARLHLVSGPAHGSLEERGALLERQLPGRSQHVDGGALGQSDPTLATIDGGGADGGGEPIDGKGHIAGWKLTRPGLFDESLELELLLGGTSARLSLARARSGIAAGRRRIGLVHATTLADSTPSRLISTGHGHGLHALGQELLPAIAIGIVVPE